MELNDLLRKHGINPEKTIVMRHRPDEPGLRKILPWLVHGRPEVFNAYQQSHSGAQEKALQKLAGDGWIASFLGLSPGEAIFCGLYRIHGCNEIGRDQFWAIPANKTLRDHGMLGWARKGRERGLWFDLQIDPSFYPDWIGRLTVTWPKPERAWWRRAERNLIPVSFISEESLFAAVMPDWKELILSWGDLSLIPASWRNALREWRAIYLIRDLKDGLAYVGSAYGSQNLLGRWQNYASSGDGGNRLLKNRKPDMFVFSILERLGPDLEPRDVIWAENTWKKRLGTNSPKGLNSN
jgi:hypothetical protein